MKNFLEAYFSPEKKASRLEKKLQNAVSLNNQKKIVSIFCEEFLFLLKKGKTGILANLILSHGSKIKDVSLAENKITSANLKKAIGLLEENKLGVCQSAALKICDCFGYKINAIEILAKQSRANDMVAQITVNNVTDKELLQVAVMYWEKYNGDVRENPAIYSALKNIAKFSIGIIPKNNPRVMEVIEQFKEAALLYAKEGYLKDAARCYEEAKMYQEACKVYEDIKDNEGISRTAEALGDLERALKFVVKPERKAKLLIQMGKFSEARKFTAGLESPDEYFVLIKETAGKRMDVKIKSHDFIGALELAYIAEVAPSKKEEILMLGRQHFDEKLVSAVSEEDIKAVYRDRVKLEELAGNFEEAGKIAEEILNDLNLASLLYEKANLFNRAIGTASEYIDEQKAGKDAKIRLAELHEKGGNLLSAAKLYESAGWYDKAYGIYESTRHFTKAIECYLKISNPSQDTLIRLYINAGEFEKVIDIYVKSGTYSDLEKALLIAKTYNFTSHIKVIQTKIAEYLSGSEEDLKRCLAQAKEEVFSSYSSVLGIDFGTTSSVVAIFNKKSKQIEIIPSSTGTEFEPSYFGVDENNHPVFGEAARLRLLIDPQNVVARVKRSLGGGGSFSIGDKKYRSEEIIANILQQLKLNGEVYLKSKVKERLHVILQNKSLRFSEEVLSEFLKQQKYDFIKDVVLTVPAYFNDNQKRATRDSAEIAGLCVKRLLHEPTAAALAYGYQKSYSGKLAVIDLGGGTLDISILDVGNGVYDVLKVGGDTKLGGSDIDTELVQHVINNIKITRGIDINESTHNQEIARLRDACEIMKINLSSADQYTMELPHFCGVPKYTFTMKRAELEKLAEPILNRLKEHIKETIKAGSNIEHFLLVGNATKMPAVRELVENTIHAKHLKGVLKDANPGTVVAAGAALEGAVLGGDLKDTLLWDVVPYSLGLAIKKKDTKTQELEISRLIEKNSRIPITKNDTYLTTADSQTEVRIQIYQGESNVPRQNYFLGDFYLGGIKPAPAGEKKIEVEFEIDNDCILEVTATDKETGNKQSIKIEGAVTLSPSEKENRRHYFVDREKTIILEEKLCELREKLGKSELIFNKAILFAEQTIPEFFELFHENIEINPRLYKVNMEQTKAIQEMFAKKDEFTDGVPRKYKDRFASVINNVKQAEEKHLDFSDKDIISKLQERVVILSNYQEALTKLIESIEKDVTNVVQEWIKILKSMEPDLDKMNQLEVANYHLIAGRVNKASETLESMALSMEGLSREAFHLLLKCYIRQGLKEQYSNTHKRFGILFGMNYPDFNQLNNFLKATDESVFLIQGISQKNGQYSASGFCIAPDLIVTSRHVVEGSNPSDINVIGKGKAFEVDKIELDPINDMAILKVKEDNNLKPLKIGEFDFVEPGEQVIAIGFPSPSSNMHSENIYISKGIVNSIRKIESASERVIFMDAKIGRGMSGGPLINNLGEVVGIVTFILYEVHHNEKGTFSGGDQPVALPIFLLRNYLMKYSVSSK